MVKLRSNDPKQNECCIGCAMWNRHQHKCWYYWDLKKGCTQFLTEAEDSPINR